jgi:LmbE family N-acetylglucosaminyl deacetylase
MREDGDRLHVVAFGAHAGDADFTMAHVLAKYAHEGHRATIVHVTLGEAGNPAMPREEYAAQRRREIEESCAVYGAEFRCLPYADAELVASPETELAFCDLIRELKPDIAITQWRGSLHRDHILTWHLVTYGALLARLPSVKRNRPPHRVGSVWFAENWEDAQGFVPEVYVDITDVYDTWIEGAGKHALFRGEVSRFPYQDYYKALARVRGEESGCRYAAAFMRHRPVEKQALDQLP